MSSGPQSGVCHGFLGLPSILPGRSMWTCSEREPFSGGGVTAGLTVQRVVCPSLAAMGEQVAMVTVDTLPWNLHEARWALARSTSAAWLSVFHEFP